VNRVAEAPVHENPALPPLFVTGGSGFVGRRVLAALARAGARDVRVLVREPDTLAAAIPMPPTWRLVRGTLDDATGWRDALRGVATVLHLASSTGKVPAAVHERVIVGGTQRLLDAAQAAGVRRCLYVSSVAAGFADRRHYFYAESKRRAEALVRAAAMETLVVRPTMVFGEGSPVLDGLRRLARLPLPLSFGDGSAMVQPIDVDDLAGLLVAALDPSLLWGGRTMTLGGADAVTTAALLRRLRTGTSADAAAVGRLVHVPIEPLRTVLALLEPLLLPVLPFTAGQLTSFTGRSDASSNDAESQSMLAVLQSRLAAPLRGLREMLHEGAAAVQHGG
jgi:NADH dehydrogenase